MFDVANRDIVFDVVNRGIVFDVVNPFLSKRFPIDEENRLALDRVKSISALSTHLDGKGFTYSTDYYQRNRKLVY